MNKEPPRIIRFINRATKLIIWFLFFSISDIHFIKKHNVKKVKMFRPKLWSITKPYRKFFTGIYENKKVFIKFSKKDKDLELESNIYLKLEEYKNNFFLKPIINKTYTQKTIIVIPFIEYAKINEVYIKKEDFVTMCNNALEICNILRKEEIIHCDIDHRNVLWDGLNLILFDFDNSYSSINGKVYRPIGGGGKHKVNDELLYCDVESFCRLLSSLKIDQDWLNIPEYKKLESFKYKFYYNKTKDELIHE